MVIIIAIDTDLSISDKYKDLPRGDDRSTFGWMFNKLKNKDK